MRACAHTTAVRRTPRSRYLEPGRPEEETQVPEAIPNSELDLFPGGRSGGD